MALPTNKALGKCYCHLQQNLTTTTHHPNGPTTTFESFSIDPDTKLMTFRDNSGLERLCLPATCLLEALRLAHDMRAHEGINRTYDFLKHQIFAPRLKRLVTSYVASCPVCRQAKPLRHPHKGLL